jgi:hypothetical protein
MEIKPGLRLRSITDDTEVVVVRGSGNVDLTCGGEPMEDAMAPSGAADVSRGAAAGHDRGSLLGKRYEDPDTGVEVLCVKGGEASIAVEGRILQVKSTKPLPASD